MKRCLGLALRNRVFVEYKSNPEGICSSISGTCAAVSLKMTPFLLIISAISSIFRKSTRLLGSRPARDPNF